MLTNWIPYQLEPGDEQSFVSWLDLGRHRIGEPFFDQTIQKCKATMHNRSIYRPFSQAALIQDWSNTLDALEPTAFIFHVSRCGSTLLTQSLSQVEPHIVIPEATVIPNYCANCS